MKKITAIRSGRGRQERVNVSLDGKFAFSLEAELATKEELQIGQELFANQIEALAKSDRFYRCRTGRLLWIELSTELESLFLRLSTMSPSSCCCW